MDGNNLTRLMWKTYQFLFEQHGFSDTITTELQGMFQIKNYYYFTFILNINFVTNVIFLEEEIDGNVCLS